MKREILAFAVLAPTVGLVALPSAWGGDVNGTVQTEGVPVPSARVTLFFTSLAEFFETRTTADGSFGFTGIPDGAMQLGVAAVGYDYQEVTVDVAGIPWQQDFVTARPAKARPPTTHHHQEIPPSSSASTAGVGGAAGWAAINSWALAFISCTTSF